MRHTSILKNRNILCAAVMSALALGSLHSTSAQAQDLIVDGSDSQTVNTPQDLGSSEAIVGNTAGSNAALTIESGGVLSGVGGVIGFDAGSEGTVTVTGTGLWTNSSVLLVGRTGTGTLNIENGGTVSGANTVSEIGDFAGSVGTVTVTGSGSSWSASSDIFVGNNGTGTLNILGGATVSSASNVSLGVLSGTGTVMVSGAGSELDAGDTVTIGDVGTGTLTLADGGVLDVDSGSGTLNIATEAGSVGTLIIGAAAGDTAVAAGTLNAANVQLGAGTGSIVFNHTDTDYTFAAAIAGDGAINHLAGVTSLTGDSSGFIGDTRVTGGTLNVTGQLGGSLAVIAGAAGANATVKVSGAGASWTNDNLLAVGGAVTGSDTGTLTIENGGTVSSVVGTIANGNGSSGTATVTGSGSSWTSDNFTVGALGTGTLTIADGGTLRSTDGFIGSVGLGTGVVTVTGDGSTWTNSASLAVGDDGTGTLTVANGGTVSGGSAVVGANAGSSGTVTVTDAGSSWTMAGPLSQLDIGDNGSGTLTVANGGTVDNSNASSGIGKTAGTGAVTVTGAGSLWTHINTLLVGDGGTGTLTVEQGGAVSDINGMIGNSAGSTGTVTVTGTGSVLTQAAQLTVGNVGTGTLLISDGGQIINGDGFVGYDVTGTGTVTVTGTGSDWTNHDSIELGVSGTGMLNVLDGATASSGTIIFVGRNAGGAGTLTVAGGGVVSSNSGDGRVTLADVAGSAGTLTIGDGAGAGILNAAQVDGGAGTAILNFNHTDTDYFFTSDGTASGAAIAITGSTAVNHLGTGTTTLTGANTYTGGTIVKFGTLAVDGGSISHVAANLIVGDVSGDDGALLIENGGTVSDATGGIGDATGSVGSTGKGAVTVTGAGSTWTNASDLFVGFLGTGTLTIADGGSVVAGGSATLGQFVGSTGTLNIGAAAGDTAVAAGTLNAATLAFGDGSGILNFNHTETNYDFDAAITGAGTINQLAGVTKLTADSSGFIGSTTISGGTLSVNNTLGGAVNVTGGTLGGSGTVSGDVAVTDGTIAAGNSPGTLTIGGNLALAAGSSLDFQLGSPSGIAGVDSDLIDVGGNLTLDGTLNVADAGGFGAGLYRLVNYGGTLTDNGLDIGAGPTGYGSANLTVQTATANQVNLLVDAALVSFWDGAGTGANGAVDGGAGTWSVTGTNWTLADGSVNGVFDPSVLLIFSGTAGTVTVDGSAGAIGLHSGMQFAADGYEIVGDAIDLAGANTIRVGDGTAAGADFTATIASDLTGTGSLDKTDLGTLVLTGSNTYTGGTTVSAGMLVGNATSLPGDIVNQAALTFDQASTGTYAGTISGTGTLAKAGEGKLVLTGDSSGYTGTTDIAAGLLAVNGSLGGAIQSTGGTLGGSGTLGNVTIGSGGTLAPGNSIGTLNVATITMHAGSTYAVQLDDGGFVAGTDNDLLNASGKATIDGGTVHVAPENGTDTGATYTPGTYTILTAAGGVTGTFDALADDYAFLDFALGYDANHVLLTSSLASTGFCLTGMSANQCAAGNGAFSQGAGHGVFDTVLALSNAEAPVALDQLSGEVHASTKTALLQDGRFAREAALGRLDTALGAAGAPAGQVTREMPQGTAFWAQSFGAWSRWDGDRNAAGTKRNIGGLFIGGDTRVADDVTLGLMAGYSRSSLHVDDRASSGTVKSRTLGGYIGDVWGAFSLKGGVARGWQKLDTSRSIAFTGFTDSLHASYKARTFQTFTEAAYGIDAGKARFEPFANLAYETLHTGDFRENGGAAALAVNGQNTHATFSTLGLRAETPLAFGQKSARLSGSLGWRRAYGDTPTATQRFVSGGDAFTVDGMPLARNALVLDAGFALDLTESATMRLSYNGQFGSGVSDQGARLGLNVDF